jgi:hypothetical protein
VLIVALKEPRKILLQKLNLTILFCYHHHGGLLLTLRRLWGNIKPSAYWDIDIWSTTSIVMILSCLCVCHMYALCI